MLSYEEFQSDLRKGKVHKCYAFCGSDEVLMEKGIDKICKKVLSSELADLNYTKFDGDEVSFSSIIGACETLPLMSEKRVIVVKKAAFLEDSNSGGQNASLNEFYDYIAKMPEYSVLIMYYVYESNREKPSHNIKKLEKKACVVEVNKLKGMAFEKVVKSLFEERGTEIEKSELALFCSTIDSNMSVVINEIEKLCAYVDGRKIKREDILAVVSGKDDSDIFNLVDFVSQKKADKALDILNELIYRGERALSILSMVERQFRLLLNLKIGMENRKSKDVLSKELRLNPYICEKMMAQSSKFSMKQIQKAMELCLDSEKVLKSSSVNEKTEMEILLVNILRA